MARQSHRLGRIGVRTLIAGLAALSAGWFLPTAANALDVCGGQWNPVVRSVTVNQGLGTYTQLTRGKTTIVRLFISAPSCAPSGSERLVTANLTAADGATTLASTGGVAPVTAANLIPKIQGPNWPTIDSYSSAPTANGTGNPIFQLPNFGTNDPSTQLTTPTQFSAAFFGKLSFQYQSVPGGAWTEVDNVPYGSLTSPLATATVAPPGNSLRVLVVPMGDASQPVSTEFPEARNGGTAVNGEYADTVVQNSMQTLSRLMPVKDGVADLASGGAGLLYRLDDAAMIDLGPNGLNEMSNGAWCGSGANWSSDPNSPNNAFVSVAYQLTSALNAWNSNPANPHADRVLGAVWQGVSLGVPAQQGCAEGYAGVAGTAAWTRLFVDQSVIGTNNLGQTTVTSDPSETGPLVGMEISHTWGSVPLNDSRDTYGDYHSGNTTADPTSTQRAYNVALAQWMSGPVSNMHYSGDSSGYTNPNGGNVSGWNNSTALFEQPDYLFNQCELTPGESNCPTTTQPGTIGSAAAGAAAIYLSGTSDGTAAGTNIHSYFMSSAQTSPSDINSVVNLFDAHLIERDATGAVVTSPAGDQHVPVRVATSDHDVDSGSVSLTVKVGAVDSVMPIDPRATSFEIWNGEPPAGSGPCTPSNMPAGCLYARSNTPAPTVTAHNSSAELTNLNAFATAPALSRPAISPNGKFVAWVGSGGIVVQGRNPSTNQPSGTQSAALSGSEPTWSPDGGSIAYTVATGDGSADIDTVTVNTTANPPTFGTPQVVYNHLLQTPPALGSTAAAHASYSPDGQWLAVAINSDIWKIQNTTGSANPVICDLSTLTATSTCVPLDTSGSDSAPAWGAAGGTPAGAGLVAFDRGSDIWSVDPNGTTAALKRVAGASAPAWGANLVAFAQGGNIWTTDTSTPASDGSWSTTTQLTGSGTGGGSDAWPSLTSDATGIAFDRPSGSSHQVMVGTIDQHNPTIQFTVSTTGDPSLVRADMYLTCAGAYEPIFFGLKPNSTSSGSSINYANFSVSYSDSRACPGGTIYAQATNGWQRSALTPLRTIPGQLSGGTTTAPDPAIGAPLPGSTYLQYDPVIAIGSSVDQSSGTNGGSISLQWTLTGPAGSNYNNTSVGSGTQIYIGAPIPDASAPGGDGWVPGLYTLCVTATNATTHQTGKSCVTYTVLPDPAHTGSNVGIAFNPQSLYVPSSGNDVTVTVTPNGQNLSKINPSSVAIVQVGSFPASIPVDTASGTTGWVSNGNGTYNAKFNRSTLSCLMAKNGLNNFYVPVVVSGSSTDGTVTFYGFDPKYPVVSPSGSSC